MYERHRKTIRNIIRRGYLDKGLVIMDNYNQTGYTDVCMTITTRINSSSHYFVIQVNEGDTDTCKD